jgi:hypothetical protein
VRIFIFSGFAAQRGLWPPRLRGFRDHTQRRLSWVYIYIYTYIIHTNTHVCYIHIYATKINDFFLHRRYRDLTSSLVQEDGVSIPNRGMKSGRLVT